MLIGFVIGAWLYVETTPPVLGRIVDARTGRVIEGSVCEGMEYADWGWTTRTRMLILSVRMDGFI